MSRGSTYIRFGEKETETETMQWKKNAQMEQKKKNSAEADLCTGR